MSCRGCGLVSLVTPGPVATITFLLQHLQVSCNTCLDSCDTSSSQSSERISLDAEGFRAASLKECLKYLHCMDYTILIISHVKDREIVI
jgi:hypothetical protein